MRREDYFSVENYETVYNKISRTWQRPVRAKTYHGLIRTVMNPQVHFAPDAEEQIGDSLDSGSRVAIALNHGSMYDPIHIAAMASRNKVFKPMIGRTMIGAKAPLFTTPVIGRIIPDLGAIPIWRDKDLADEDTPTAEVERLKELRKKSGATFVKTEIKGMNQGLHMAKHVEGTRNKVDHKEIQEVFPGYGKVVSGVAENVGVLMVTAAFYYGDGDTHTNRKPTMYVDVLEDQDRSDPLVIADNLKPALQNSLDHAIDLHSQ